MSPNGNDHKVMIGFMRNMAGDTRIVIGSSRGVLRLLHRYGINVAQRSLCNRKAG